MLECDDGKAQLKGLEIAIRDIFEETSASGAKRTFARCVSGVLVGPTNKPLERPDLFISAFLVV
jgi:hypothetical protein